MGTGGIRGSMTRPFPTLILFSGVTWLTAGLTAGPAPVARLDLSVQESDLTPTITLHEHDNRTVEEYRINNHTYMTKITPRVGAPYYLVDDDGSGETQWLRDPGDRTLRVPQWTLLRW